MKKTSFSILLMACALPMTLMAGAQLERANVIAEGRVASIHVSFSAAERLTYFAFFREDHTLVVDFPGVTNRVDWAEVAVQGVKSIALLPLNPEVEEGVSLLLALQSDSTYEIKELPGQIVFSILSGEQTPLSASLSDPDLGAKPLISNDTTANTGAPLASNRDASERVFSKSIKGEMGPGKLGQMDIQIGKAGRIELKNVAGKYKTFYLREPNRFVVDLMDTVLSLPEREVNLNHASVSQIRIRQFQAQPTAIVRIVLDLASDAQIDVSSESGSLALSFGDAETSSAIDDPRVSEELKVAENVPNEPQAEASSTAIAAEMVPENPVQNLEPASEAVVLAVTAPQESELPETQAVNEPVKEDSQKDYSAQAPELPSQDQEVVKQGLEQSAPVLADTSIPESRDVMSLPVVEVAEQKPEQLPEVDASLKLEKPELPELKAVAEVKSADKKSAPAFLPATEADMALAEFTKKASEKVTLAEVVPNLKSKKRKGKPLIVTNEAIDNQKALLEMRLMQNEQGGAEDFETIFQNKEGEFGFDRIEGEPTEYRGFEISVIDVKNVSVVDLLRFIADQVNINLYVDSSVTDALKATYRFRNIPWDQAMDIILRNANLEKEFTNNVLRVATVDKFQYEEQKRGALRELREISVPTETVTVNLSYAKAKEVMPIIQNYLSPRGKILQDFRTNMLIIEDIPKRMVGIRALIRKLDKMVSQVSIESRIVETTKRFLKELGIQWGLAAKYTPELGTNTGVTFPQRVQVGGPVFGRTSPGGLAGGYAINLPIVQENPSGIGLSLGNFLDNFKLDISLQMLETEGDGQIIASPKVTTQNNQSALIKSGQLIPIQTIQRGTITIKYIEAVLQLKVTPHITAEETIIMDLEVTKSDIDLTQVINGNPIINTREATTQVLVKNGGTAVIGGIFSLTEQNQARGIPGLRTVPLLKRIFSSDLKNYENKEMLIFVTPRIIKY